MTPRSLIVWRDSPLDLERPLWNWTAEAWGGEVRVAHARSFGPERAALDWGDSSVRELHVGPEPQAAIGFVRDELRDFDNALHVFYGLRGPTGRFLDIVSHTTSAPVVIVAERPTRHVRGVLGPARALASKGVYARLARRYRERIAAFLAMGVKGCREYEAAGFHADTLFPFMYAPFDPTMLTGSRDRVAGEPVRFIYVGRLDSRHKGLDVLLEVVGGLNSPSAWTLDIVGGYGDLTQHVTDFAAEHSSVNYLGAWQPGEVVRRLAAYDVCVVPSRYDGWNAVANHAVNAGIGTIISNQATSDELIRASGAGRVVRAGSTRALSNAMTQVINRPDLALGFAASARGYRASISTERVGAYLLDVLFHASGDRGLTPRPECPWL